MKAEPFLGELFSMQGRVAVITGATGALGGAIARGLGAAGAAVGLLARRAEVLEDRALALRGEGTDALALPADVLAADQLTRARERVLQRWGRLDVLINAAGGNIAAATLDPDREIAQLPRQAFADVVDLNLMGTWLSCQAFAPALAAGGAADGVIVNVSSMAAGRALTGVGGYGAAKAAVEALTRWLAVELAHRHDSAVRVNAIAPGFFIGEQNRALLLDEHDRPTDRGQRVLAHTPMQRFGEPGDLTGTVIWLCSPAARFVTGIVVPIDGGFSAYSGV